MVITQIHFDVIHDLVEYMIPVTETYFSSRVRGYQLSNICIYRIYYKHLLHYNQVSHYRWYVYCMKHQEDPYILTPLFFDLSPYLELNMDIHDANPHPKAVKHWLNNRIYSTLNIHPKIVEKYIERGYINGYFSKNPNDPVIDYLLEHPHLIYWHFFLKNTNPRAVDYCIRMWNEIPRKDQRYFSSNKSQRVVDWLIQNPQFISYYIEKNPINYNYNRLKYVQSKRILVKIF